MSARIARGSAGARPRAKPRASAKGKGRGKSPSAVPDAVGRFGLWLLAGMVIALGLAVASIFGLPQMAGAAAGEAIGRAGFTVRRVEIKGLDRMERLPVYAVALDQESMAMPLVDLDATRAKLMRFGWVKEARVSRRLPDTLVVDIVERRPAAIWQHNRRLALVDNEGVVLAPVKLDAMPDLPLVIGPAANLHTRELEEMIAGSAVKPMVAGATWIGGRRWDLRFQSGETLALPEGEQAAKKALAHFVRMDQQTPLLGQGYVRFDMRNPGQITVRVSNLPGGKVPDVEEPAPPAAAPPASANVAETI